MSTNSPTISSVVYTVEIPDNTTTSYSTITVTGTALANTKVHLMDEEKNPVGDEVDVNAWGVWTVTLPSLPSHKYIIQALGLTDSKPVSAPRTFTVYDGNPPTKA